MKETPASNVEIDEQIEIHVDEKSSSNEKLSRDLREERWEKGCRNENPIKFCICHKENF